ncbi:MAG: class I SAM-dependent methyltransferase [Thaumarchaeota archaeon]|nr:class I SAM-dependent methyltransferase [Nitrososphaerota archaeon]
MWRARHVLKKISRKNEMTKEEWAYYKKLYEEVHNLDGAKDITAENTKAQFAEQWKNFPTGRYLLSDPSFKNNVDSIISEQEILIKREWFRGKNVLDAGCGNGRWSYGLAKLGAKLTCVDINPIAIEETRKALSEFGNEFTFLVSSLEELNLAEGSFDLVFSWGVLHHCVSFTKSLQNLTRVLKNGGFLYLYLYGRDSLPMEKDLELFKRRVEYNKTTEQKKRHQILLEQAGGNKDMLNQAHDLLAPTINRRFTFDQVKTILERLGYVDVTRTIKSTEIFVRAVKGNNISQDIFLPPREPPYWFNK